MKGIEQGCYKGWSCQGPKVVLRRSLTVLPLGLAHFPWHNTRKKQCPSPPGRVQPSGRKETSGVQTWKKVGFSGTEGGSVDPEGKVVHWSARIKIRKTGSEEVKGVEHEKQGGRLCA